jgi:hypothetical protein
MISMALQGSTNVSVLGNIFAEVFSLPPWCSYLVWVLAYIIFIAINFESKRFFRVNLILNSYCCIVLGIYIIWMLFMLPGKGNISAISMDGKITSSQVPTAINVIYTLPYAIWWFVGMEVNP